MLVGWHDGPRAVDSCLRAGDLWRSLTCYARLPARPGEGPIGSHEARQHGRDQLSRLARLARLTTEELGVGYEIAMHRRRQLDREADGLVVEERAEFQARGHLVLSQGVPRVEARMNGEDVPLGGASTRSRVTMTRTG